MENRRQFAIDNAGKRFKFGRRIVTVVGYRDNGLSITGDYVLVSHKRIGWDRNPEHGNIRILEELNHGKEKKYKRKDRIQIRSVFQFEIGCALRAR